MAIASLKIHQFRNLMNVELLPQLDGLNVIYGDNGSGKTSLLEAMHYLSCGRSFRGATYSQLIQHQKDKFSIFSQIMGQSQSLLSMGIEREISGLVRLKIAEKNTHSIAELAVHLPMRLINSQSHAIFESGPSNRRKYLDWGLFYQSHSFLAIWRQFIQVLRQRNRVLREKRSRDELEPWTHAFCKYAIEINMLRRNYIRALIPTILEVCEELLGMTDFQFNYQPGWGDCHESNQEWDVTHHETNLVASLSRVYAEEMRFGYSIYGPHKADLEILFNKVPVKHFLSRGQQKLLICAMIVAQGKLLKNHQLIYLIDDLPAELDEESEQKLTSLLSKQKTQVFVTAIKQNWLGNKRYHADIPGKVFHVKHGQVELPMGDVK